MQAAEDSIVELLGAVEISDIRAFSVETSCAVEGSCVVEILGAIEVPDVVVFSALVSGVDGYGTSSRRKNDEDNVFGDPRLW